MPRTTTLAIDVGDFDIASMLRCGTRLREAGSTASSYEEAASRIVRLLFDACVDPRTGDRTCALVRFYKTHEYQRLDPARQAFARRQLGAIEPTPAMRSLVLLGSAGSEQAWNEPLRSRAHLAIPLASEAMVQKAPMIARLFEQFGVTPKDVLAPSSAVLPRREGRTYNVFHVEHAPGSPFIPVQGDFVERYGIRSVVGFGGRLRSGNLFATILFSRAHIPKESAKRFRPLAVDAKAGLFFLDEEKTFSG